MFIDILLELCVHYGFLWVSLFLLEELGLDLAKRRCGSWGWCKTYYGCDLLYDAEWLFGMNHPKLRKRPWPKKVLIALILPLYRLYSIPRTLLEAYGDAREMEEEYHEMYTEAVEDINRLTKKLES